MTAAVSEVRSLDASATQTLKVPGSADFVALEGDDAWVTNVGRVEKLRAGSPVPIASVPIEEPGGAPAVGFGSLWVADCRNGTLVRVDLASHRAVAAIPTGILATTRLVAGSMRCTLPSPAGVPSDEDAIQTESKP